MIAACERLNIADYSIALDDYVANDRRESMVPLADIIKVDFERTTPQERAQLVKKQGGLRCRMLAEKVEMLEQFQAAQHAGFVYFQGYFFRRPEGAYRGPLCKTAATLDLHWMRGTRSMKKFPTATLPVLALRAHWLQALKRKRSFRIVFPVASGLPRIEETCARVGCYPQCEKGRRER